MGILCLMRFAPVVILAVLLGAAAAASAFGDTRYLDSRKQRQLIDVQHLVYDERFDAADSLAADMIETRPGDPAGWFSAASVLLARMVAAEQDTATQRFGRLLDSVMCYSDAVLDTCDDNTAAWMHLWRGHALTHRSLWESHFGSMLRAVRVAFDAADEYQAGLERDSTVEDLYFGIGMFHYWKSAKAGLLRSVGVIADDIELGLAELRRAADHAAISRDAARNGLVWIYLDRQQYDSVITLCEQLLERFPGSKVFLWPLAKATCNKRDYNRAISVYQQMREEYTQNPGNYYNLLTCDFHIAQCYDMTGRRDKLSAVARRARAYFDNLPSDTERRLRDEIAYLKRAARL